MPITKSAKKTVRKNEKKKVSNNNIRTREMNMYKKAVKAIESGHEDAEKLYKAAIKEADKAKSKGIIKKNKAARHKSKLTLKLKKANEEVKEEK